ncbi:DUF1934 domain-containing protein [Melghirimyces algeriensis]|uniref:Uncharacterized beta-barrel protein YwiB, DUF1934 family n=1 Tax=Melghirimyces algeriensis TaxID=910412 RepID=A0A521D8Z5_9BACL|nr:DUF1934 domain-containing protein [Melghirimyces algeriensis]SMO68158.1 Uncharacterized beta-barrel protein YwiB, DUF1934 family [Melghirimyces algeriensis]
MDRIRLSIVSLIDSEDGERQEPIEQQMEGWFQTRENRWILKYTEKPGTEDEVKTTVKADQDEVTVIRQGAVSYRQRYCPGKMTSCLIETPGGVAEMDVQTLSYQRERLDEGGQVQFSFRLFMEGEALGRYQLTIQWTEVAAST